MEFQMTKAKTPAAKAPTTKPAAEPKAVKPLKASIAMDASSALVAKHIMSIAARGAKLDNDIHSGAMACLYHADKHGDITLMNRLLMAMPKSTRRNALAQWAVAFGKFKPNEDKSTLETAPLAFDKAKSTDIPAAQAKPFWDFRNVREGTTEWLFSDYIQGVMRTLAAHAIKDGPEAAKAKAALDSIKGVTEALALPANGEPKQAAIPPAGVTERRAVAVH
jgi:hypothetical protein